MTDPTASGPNPSGCRYCHGSGVVDNPQYVGACHHCNGNGHCECVACQLASSRAECARLTAQLAAATARAGEVESDRDVACSNVDALMEKYQAARAALDRPRGGDAAPAAMERLWRSCADNCSMSMGAGVCDCGAHHFNEGMGALVAALRAGGGR